MSNYIESRASYNTIIFYAENIASYNTILTIKALKCKYKRSYTLKKKKKNGNESLYIKTINLFGSPLTFPFLFYLIISCLLCFTSSPLFLSPMPSHSIVSPLVLCYSLSLSLHHSVALSPLCSHLHHSIKISLFGCDG